LRVGQTQIEHHQIEGRMGPQGAEGRLQRGHAGDPAAGHGHFKAIGDRLGDDRMIVADHEAPRRQGCGAVRIGLDAGGVVGGRLVQAGVHIGHR